MNSTDKHLQPICENSMLADFNCPCCGLDTPQLFEGYCKTCLEEKNYQLYDHIAQYDSWSKLTYEERNANINLAVKFFQTM
jgi:hypothetical protein